MTIIYEKEQLSEIIAAVQAGQTIAFPTDTVYGLGVISTDAQALERLKAAKGRPDSKPIPTMVASVEQLRTGIGGCQDLRRALSLARRLEEVRRGLDFHVGAGHVAGWLCAGSF